MEPPSIPHVSYSHVHQSLPQSDHRKGFREDSCTGRLECQIDGSHWRSLLD